MPTQVLPITDLAKAGVVMDTPSVSLPPNVFSDVSNIRFRDGAIRKLEGEILEQDSSDVAYIAYWPGPFRRMYVVVQNITSETANIILYDVDSGASHTAGGFQYQSSRFPTAPTNIRYQHTLFNGGFNIIINDGFNTPLYLTDAETFTDITIAAPLPNWDSYLAQENVVSVVWEGDTTEIPLGRPVSLDLDVINGATGDFLRSNQVGSQRIIYRVIPRDPSLPILTQQVSRLVVTADDPNDPDSWPTSDDPVNYQTESGISYFTVSDQDIASVNWIINPRPRDESVTPTLVGAEIGDTIEVAIQERPAIIVTAGVVRAYGNLLVAGNLRETSGNTILRNLAGVIRTSDVAPPGNIPANWNPFRNGANTADEFTLSSTGTVQDMVELQGNLFIYTTNSIHSLQQTGGNIPFGIRPVTDSYGADNTGSVLEVDGKHIVVGSDDVYVFAGHPGSITSIADSRVRHQPFFNSGDVRILRYSRYDELWFYTPGQADMFIWNYRDNTWSRRNQTTPVVGNPGPNTILFTNGTIVYQSDPEVYSPVVGSRYETFVERKRLAITPEFTTETLVSVGILSEGEATFDVSAVGTSRPAENMTLPGADPNVTPFVSAGDPMADGDYKADLRTHGRLLNYRIEDTTNTEWSIAGLQFDIGTGGTR